VQSRYSTALSEIVVTRPNLCFFIQNKENNSEKSKK
jgi:hypothetical protein